MVAAAVTPAMPTLQHGLVWGFRFDAAGHGVPWTGQGPIDLAGEDGGFVWLHLNLVDQRACQWLNTLEALPAPVRALLTAPDQHQRVLVQDGLLAAVLHDFKRGLDRRSRHVDALHLVLGQRFLVSGRHRPLHATDTVRRAIEAGRPMRDPVDILEALISEIAETIGAVVDTQLAEVEAIEDLLVADRAGGDQGDLTAIRRQSMLLHRQLRGLRSMVHRVEREPPERLPSAWIDAASRLAQRLDTLDDDVITLQQQARLLLEEFELRAAGRTNRHLYMLSVITTLMLPATLMAGIFGMNFTGMPLAEAEFGFLIGVLLVAGSPLLIYFALRASGILKR